MTEVKILPNRLCGTVQAGGLYATGEMSRSGTLLPFTALVAPFEAEIPNPRKPFVVDIGETLTEMVLLPPGAQQGFAGLPPTGVADLWGKKYYPTPWDARLETMQKGVCRRIAQLPDIPTPYPVLMMHMEAVVAHHETFTSRTYRQAHQDIKVWLKENTTDTTWSRIDGRTQVAVHDRPWRAAESLGRKGDPTYADHPYVALWAVIKALKKARKLSKLCQARACDLSLEQGVFGLTWITGYARVLHDDETNVTPEEAARGITPAVSEEDPRATESAKQKLRKDMGVE